MVKGRAGLVAAYSSGQCLHEKSRRLQAETALLRVFCVCTPSQNSLKAARSISGSFGADLWAPSRGEGFCTPKCRQMRAETSWRRALVPACEPRSCGGKGLFGLRRKAEG